MVGRVAAVAWLSVILTTPCTAAAQAVPQASAPAAEVANVEPGETVILRRSPKPITDVQASSGSASVVAPSGRSDDHVLVYFAPASGVTADVVTYKIEGKSEARTVNVRTSPPTLASSEIYSQSFKSLFVLFILAVLVESGLAVLFAWRPYLRFFDTRTMNTVIAVAFSLAFVLLFNLDITTNLVNVYLVPNAPYPANFPGYLLTALIIAGGSGGVHRLLTAFGFRAPGDPTEPPPVRVPPTEAWVATKLIRKDAVGTVNVLLGSPAQPHLVGTIESGTLTRSPLLRLFVRDRGRFPPSGGYRTTPGQDCLVKLVGHNKAGDLLERSWGPYNLAPGALVDIDLEL